MGRPRLTDEERAASAARRKEKKREYMKKYCAKPDVKERVRNACREWRHNNPERYAAIQMRYYQNKLQKAMETANA